MKFQIFFRLKQLISVRAESKNFKEVEINEIKEDGEDDGKKKKHRREKIGFRDRKVKYN